MNKISKPVEVSLGSLRMFRIMLSLIFIVASLGHFFKVDAMVARIESSSFGSVGYLLGKPEVAVVLSGAVMLAAGLSLLIGFYTRYAAIALIAVIIPITITIQIGQVATMGPLFKNVAILGGLLLFALNPLKQKQ